MLPTQYERLWAIELAAERLFLQDHPTGSFARRLPQFRAGDPDPVGDVYRHKAARLIGGTPVPSPVVLFKPPHSHR